MSAGSATDPGLGRGPGQPGAGGGPVPPKPTSPARNFGRAVQNLLTTLVALVVAGLRKLRQWNRRDGAGESGLAQLIEVQALQTAGDAMVAVAMAGSLFFSVPTHQARSRVALVLLITMAPFAVVAPLLGPLLDRFRHGRRIAFSVTMMARAVLAIVIGHSLRGGVEAIALYPAALGVLVASKAFTVAKAAAVPRLVPPRLSLVAANSRLTIATIIATAVGGGVAIALRKTLGATDEMLVGAVVYALAGALALRLPRRADGGPAETMAAAAGPPGARRRWRRLAFPGEVRRAITTAASLRWLSGFLLFYGAFVVREHSLGGLTSNEALVALAIGIGGGNFLGTAAGARIKQLLSTPVGIGLVAATAGMSILAAIDFTLPTAVGLAIVVSATAAMTKLSLDATIQERVDETIRSSTFGRSETLMQLVWVVGGFVGILLPTDPQVGFSVASAVLFASIALSLIARESTRRSGAE